MVEISPKNTKENLGSQNICGRVGGPERSCELHKNNKAEGVKLDRSRFYNGRTARSREHLQRKLRAAYVPVRGWKSDKTSPRCVYPDPWLSTLVREHPEHQLQKGFYVCPAGAPALGLSDPIFLCPLGIQTYAFACPVTVFQKNRICVFDFLQGITAKSVFCLRDFGLFFFFETKFRGFIIL